MLQRFGYDDDADNETCVAQEARADVEVAWRHVRNAQPLAAGGLMTSAGTGAAVSRSMLSLSPNSTSFGVVFTPFSVRHELNE